MIDSEYRVSPERLLKRRSELKLTRSDVADRIGMSDPAYLYQMEKSAKNCSVDLAMRLAFALECHVSDLLDVYPTS